METVDELCMQLEKASKIEEISVQGYCPSRHIKFACSRPKGHLGFHIALGDEQGLIVMWHDTLSDKDFNTLKVFWEEMEKIYPD